VSAAQRPAATYRRRAARLGRASSDGRWPSSRRDRAAPSAVRRRLASERKGPPGHAGGAPIPGRSRWPWPD